MVAEYRKRKIPLDNIVHGLVLLEGGSSGARTSSTRPRFPDPQGHDRQGARAERALHDLGVAEVLSRHGQLQGTRRRRIHVPRQHRGGRARTGWARATPRRSTIRIRRPARDMYWRQVNEKLNVLGVDAWWMDATEPDLHSNLDIDSIKARIGPDRDGPGGELLQLPIALVHTGGVYEGSRAGAVPTSACSSSRARASPASSAMPPRCGAATSPRAGTICTTRSPRA